MPKSVPFSQLDLKSGASSLIWALPFDGDGNGRHRFNDSNHAKNFCRYLFSQSKAHPSNDRTRRNLYREFGAAGELIEEAYLDQPIKQMNSFLKRRFPASKAEELLFDDGCYPIFAIRNASGTIFTNLTSQPRPAGSSDPRPLNHPLFGHILASCKREGRNVAEITKAVTEFFGTSEIVPFDNLPASPAVLEVEKMVQAVVRKLLGSGQDVVMTVAHRDQLDHNPIYHIHRLVRMPG